jgi:tRNA pseudouridine38-40 synthase
VQETLERALGRVLRLEPPPRLTVAGRTDSGVHARGQVAHVDVPAAAWEAVAASIVRRLRGVLPHDIRVSRAVPAAAGFDARFSALSRRYAYRVCDDPAGPDPLRRWEVLAHPGPLDVEAMDAAARALLGEHDFAAYCRRREGATTVRRLLGFSWARQADGLAVAAVEADAFCHSMVRALVGASLAVGEGRRPTSWPADVLAGRRRDPGVMVVRPHGLTLEEVRYPADADLFARAEETRRIRVPGVC